MSMINCNVNTMIGHNMTSLLIQDTIFRLLFYFISVGILSNLGFKGKTSYNRKVDPKA